MRFAGVGGRGRELLLFTVSLTVISVFLNYGKINTREKEIFGYFKDI